MKELGLLAVVFVSSDRKGAHPVLRGFVGESIFAGSEPCPSHVKRNAAGAESKVPLIPEHVWVTAKQRKARPPTPSLMPGA